MTKIRRRAIPDVLPNIDSHNNALKALAEGYQQLSGQRGVPLGWAVTFGDLVDMGLVTEQQVLEQIATRDR
jgi:hypothetical protein